MSSTSWTEVTNYIKTQLKPGVLGHTDVQKILNSILAVINQINAGDFTPTPESIWKADVTYPANTTPVLWQDKWLVSNTANNLGNVPISTAGVVHPTWRVISASVGSGVDEWEAKVYPNTLEIVFVDGALYYLDREEVGDSPYVSVDFADELLDGKWVSLGGSAPPHNSLQGLNQGDYQHLTAGELATLQGITRSLDEMGALIRYNFPSKVSGSAGVDANDFVTKSQMENAGYLTSLPAHTHSIANVTGLQDALDAKISSQWGTNGTSIFYNGGNVGIGTNEPLAPLHIGNRNVNNSGNAQILISRVINSTVNNDHAFADSSIYSPLTNGLAYASYDARINIAGSSNIDHYAAFQDGTVNNNSGIIDNYWGFISSVRTNSGTITDYQHFEATNIKGNGNVTNQYGIRIRELLKGVNNWAIYTDGNTKSYFGGKIGVGSESTNPDKNIEIRTANGSDATLRIRQNSQNYWDISSPASSTSLTISDITGERLRITELGNIGIGINNPEFWAGRLAIGGGDLSIAQGNRIRLFNASGNGVASIQGSGINELIFTTSSSFTERMRINSSGSILINQTVSSGERLQVTGNAKIVGNVTATAFFQSSDMRLKRLIDARYDADAIDAISYKWKSKKQDTKNHVGYSAQQVAQYMPDAVTEGGDGNLSVNYIEVLVAKVAMLESKLKRHGLD